MTPTDFILELTFLEYYRLSVNVAQIGHRIFTKLKQLIS